jgi:hypothetical protein
VLLFLIKLKIDLPIVYKPTIDKAISSNPMIKSELEYSLLASISLRIGLSGDNSLIFSGLALIGATGGISVSLKGLFSKGLGCFGSNTMYLT